MPVVPHLGILQMNINYKKNSLSKPTKKMIAYNLQSVIEIEPKSSKTTVKRL